MIWPATGSGILSTTTGYIVATGVGYSCSSQLLRKVDPVCKYIGLLFTAVLTTLLQYLLVIVDYYCFYHYYCCCYYSFTASTTSSTITQYHCLLFEYYM